MSLAALLPRIFGRTRPAVVANLSGVEAEIPPAPIADRPVELPTLDELCRLAPDKFESWVGDIFRAEGFEVELVGTQPGSRLGDHGIDLIVTSSDERGIVQCKKYREWKAGEPTIRDLYGTLMSERADRAYLVTTGRVTRPAREWIGGKPIEIWDGRHLVEAGYAQGWRSAAAHRPPAVAGTATPELPVNAPATALSCPRCGANMVRRIARKGSHSGEEFLGCSTYPRCHAKLQLDGAPR